MLPAPAENAILDGLQKGVEHLGISPLQRRQPPLNSFFAGKWLWIPLVAQDLVESAGQVLRTVHCLIVSRTRLTRVSSPFHTHRAEDRTLTWANFRTLLRPQLFRHRRICGCWMFHLSDIQFPRTVIPQSVPVPVSGTI